MEDETRDEESREHFKYDGWGLTHKVVGKETEDQVIIIRRVFFNADGSEVTGNYWSVMFGPWGNRCSLDGKVTEEEFLKGVEQDGWLIRLFVRQSTELGCPEYAVDVNGETRTMLPIAAEDLVRHFGG